jgi:long-chain acyl-CoA synthetase
MTSSGQHDAAGSAATNWNVHTLLNMIIARGHDPAVVVTGADGSSVTSSEALVLHATGIAGSLLERGVSRGEPVALWAPNSADWIAVALGIMAAGAILVPIDDLLDDAQVMALLRWSGVRRIFSSSRHMASAANGLIQLGVVATAVDECSDIGGIPLDSLPIPGSEDAAVLSWTSGTTAAPKGFFLSYRNIATNIAALCQLHIVDRNDHVLLPLPLHHAYPFIVGTLTPLTIGAPLVLPGEIAGPAIIRALRDENVATIVGVPRLYEAMLAAIDARVTSRGRIARFGWRLLLRALGTVQRKTGLRPGALLFTGVRHHIGPRLRNLVSGGARLGLETARQLEALGWTVLSGYGLAETASLFTGNRPEDRCLASAGKPLADGEIRIAAADEEGVGEIELRGSSITSGYLNNPEANQTSFTADGWFRTGDLGFVDRRGFLHVTGRSKEVLVLAGGKKVNPEDLEQYYASVPQIRELAILEYEGQLVALVQPEPAPIREMGTLNLREGIRVALAERAQGLPAYQRLSGFALVSTALPRTRLGKYQRFLLPALYRQAMAGGLRREPRPLSTEDRMLLQDPTANAVWKLLQDRYPEHELDLDVDLGLELSVDSFAWMELAITLQDRFGVRLSESEVADIVTVRDLLSCCATKGQRSERPEPAVATAGQETDNWLASPGPFVGLLGLMLYGVNWLVMRVLFHLRVSGIEHLPHSGAFVIAPNHTSYLDPFALAAALPLRRARNTYWAAFATLLFKTRVRRLFSRAAHVFPVDERRPDKAIAAAVQILASGRTAVWFPEGWRSPDGELQRFQPGIGQVLLRTGAVAVPVYICGAFEAWPRHRRLPRPGRISVTFARCEPVEVLRGADSGSTDEERIATALRDRVLEVAKFGRPASSGGTHGPSSPPS